MTTPDGTTFLEEQIDRWRGYLARRRASRSVDLTELEDRLREHLAALTGAGLAPGEAFLIAVRRMSELDTPSRHFAQEHGDRLWKQLVVSTSDEVEPQAATRLEAYVAFGLAVAAAVAVKLPALFGVRLETHEGFYVRNASLFVLPLLVGFFAWKRRLDTRTTRWLAGGFVAAAVMVNVYPFGPGLVETFADTEALAGLHLPIALWLLVGIAYAGDRWREVAGRMDFVRFSGELFIYYVLIALGGGVLTGFTAITFQAIGIDIEPFFESWLLPCGAAGGVLVASWLVEAKQSVMENMAPVLARLFTPFFAAALVTFLATLLWTGRGMDIERGVLIAFDLLLVVVLGLLLYSVSARDPTSPPGAFDVLQVVLLTSALLADAVALWAIAARITEFGFTPNRVAGLGFNVILMANLAWSAVLCIRFLGGQGSFAALERWQTSYLPVYAAWAATVVIVFPPLFGYV